MTQRVREAVAEFLGTLLLVVFGVGTAVFGIESVGPLAVCFAFGLVLLALAYAIGPTSGCHINPAVTLGVLIRGGITVQRAVLYWVVQFLGAIAGAAILKLMVSDFGKVEDQTGALGTNNWGPNISAGGAFVLEVILTFLLVMIVLLVTGRAASPGFAGLAIGLTLVVVHTAGIHLDGTSVNPARSFGPALFEGGDALTHVWLFIVAPLVGAAIAALVVPFVETLRAPTEADPTGADVP